MSMPCYDRPRTVLIANGAAVAYSARDDDPTSQLVARAQAGEVDAFEALYRAHVKRVYALCMRLAGDPDEAQELVQDVFVRAWEKLEQFRFESAFSSWLHRLTINVVFGTWRSRGRQRSRVVAIEDAGTVAEPQHEPQPRLAIDLERAIAQLPRGARTVFVLYEIEGYPHAEIARLMGLAEGTCKAQLHRARRLLREVLA